MANKAMFGIRTTIRGGKETRDNMRKLSPYVQGVLEKILIPVTEMFQVGAKQVLQKSVKSEYNTKKLENSIITQYNIKKLMGSTGPDGSAKNRKGQPYHEWVEFGHYMTGGKTMFNPKNPSSSNYGSARWWPGYHYMTKSWNKNRKKASDDVKLSVGKGLKNYAKDARGNISHLATGKIVGRMK